MQHWNLFSRQAKETQETAACALAGINCSGQLDLAAGLDCGDRIQPKACFALTEAGYSVSVKAQRTYTCPAAKERVALRWSCLALCVTIVFSLISIVKGIPEVLGVTGNWEMRATSSRESSCRCRDE